MLNEMHCHVLHHKVIQLICWEIEFAPKISLIEFIHYRATSVFTRMTSNDDKEFFFDDTRHDPLS